MERGSPIFQTVTVCSREYLYTINTIHVKPLYVVDCGTPPLPAAGGYQLVSTLYGARVTYFCEPGYELVGEATAVCQASAPGSWSGAPTCLSEHVFLKKRLNTSQFRLCILFS